MSGPPRVALLIESSRAYGRELLSGIAAFLQTHGPWSVFHQERGLGDGAPSWLRGWKGDGVIARFETRELVQRVRKLRIPTVDLRCRFKLPGIPRIETDDRLVVKLGVEHLAGRGLRHFAYCGFTAANYSERRLSFFRELLGEAAIHIFEGPPLQAGSDTGLDNVSDTVRGEVAGMSQDSRLARWLEALPRPVGVFACNDIRAQQVLNVCRANGVSVPDDVAVIGVDNDEVLCNLSYPSLSSVEPDARQIGYQAAALLERMMQGEPGPAAKLFVPPRGVIARASTEGLAIADRHVAAALRFIRENACNGLDVRQVLAQVPLSRSTLERRFHEYLGRSPKEEIIRIRLGRVKQLLAETDYTLAAIARRTGFQYVEHLSTLFAQKIGQTPGQFRRAARATRTQSSS
jgi:LacI family transcriptional regulator